jgi:hypothetical protein
MIEAAAPRASTDRSTLPTEDVDRLRTIID